MAFRYGRQMAKVIGIGGFFFKSKSGSKKLGAWYRKHLGVEVEDWGGAQFQWEEHPKPTPSTSRPRASRT